MNIVVLCGTLSRAPEARTLESGSVLLQLDVTTPVASGYTTVPVVWFDPPASWVFAVGDEVVVTGSVRRRFFRAGGSTQSRTEVVADVMMAASNRRGVARLLSGVSRALAER